MPRLHNDQCNNAYFDEMDRYPERLTKDESIDLARKAQGGDEDAKERLIGGHLRYVVGYARKWARDGRTLDDMIQYGNLGLMDALRTFDPDKGYHFLTHARWYVRWHIQQGCSKSGVVCVPQRSYMDEDNVCKDIGPLRLAKFRGVELNKPLSEGSDTERIDMMEGDFPAPDEKVDHCLLKKAVQRAMDDRLTATQAEVVRMRMDGKTMYEIGDAVGITHQGVSQSLRRSYKKLLTPLREECIIRSG